MKSCSEEKSSWVGLGVIGLGGRGRGLLGNLLDIEDCAVLALCDTEEDVLSMARDQVLEAGRPEPDLYTDYRKLLDRDDIEGVIIPSDWSSHIEISIAAMKAEVYAAPEVGGVASLEECWELVRTSEETGIPCMLLENCCYGRDEMTILNMVKKNLFGELIHCQCGYEHDLRQLLVSRWDEKKYFRIEHHLNRNGDLYPTHGLGPVAKYLDINRGNRFLTLTSMASKARGLRKWAAENLGKEHTLARSDYAKGDIVTTMIRCAGGETILIIHDVSLPRPYSRGGRVQGTEGIWMEDNNSIHLEKESPEHGWESFDDYRDEYEHPLWKEYQKEGVRGGHGGMDYLLLKAFVESVRKKEQTPIDVYDTAAWRAVTVLSEQSIARGSMPVDFPDFTKGKWMDRGTGPKSKYSLAEVDEDLF